jgi:hypothetical protein
MSTNPYTAALEKFRVRKAMSSLLRSKYFERNFRARMNHVRGYPRHSFFYCEKKLNKKKGLGNAHPVLPRHSNFAGTKSHLLGT